jgi:hypothetical protein
MKHVSPDQGSFLIQDPETHMDIPNPVIFDETPTVSQIPALDYDPTKVDPNPGLATPLVEGWSMLHKTLLEIARARSNQGFIQLPEKSREVKAFADQVDKSPEETQELVQDTVKKGSHYKTAQLRMNAYRDKQVRRTLSYNALHKIAPDSVVRDLLPMSVSNVEHQHFYGITPDQITAKAKKRQTIARYVKKHQ